MALPETAPEPEPVPATEEPVPREFPCPDCGHAYKTPQGLAGHRRLAHSASTVRALDERDRELEEHGRALESKSAEIARREAAARRLEADAARRKREIDETGPSSIGLAQCGDCGAWFDDSDRLRTHARSVHPLDEKVASEVGVSTGRVNDVWTEARHKQKRHPNETTEQIVKRFWSGTDQKILRALLDHNAAFKFEGEE
jgi:hypothetical protein